SPRLSRLYVAPGNAGTAQIASPDVGTDIQNAPISADDTAALAAFARENEVELVIVGPEVPLALGLADELQSVGLKVFGPSRTAAQIEASKAFAKAFMARHSIPTARFVTFTDYEKARAHLQTVGSSVVIKASGLAAGKGVLLPESAQEAEQALRRVLLQGEFGAAGEQVLIEERLTGEEVSLLAFTDGVTVLPMPPVQDHKRLRDGDEGPNTGGMGACAPAPICPPALVEEITRTVLQPAVDGLRQEARPFVGVLYAGLMLTEDGPQVLEFNCRFGDPETQVLLPLLDSDLLDIAEACVEGRLSQIDVRWSSGAAACVVLASEGYPGRYAKGREIAGLDSAGMSPDTVVFHAGTGFGPEGDRVLTEGGRVLGVTGWGATIEAALKSAYAAVEHISFEGMQYRRDIGRRAMEVTQ
ncbi:MAG: phosphoribosylamine--glycine ligase, partial [Anaerolineales bacterium]